MVVSRGIAQRWIPAFAGMTVFSEIIGQTLRSAPTISDGFCYFNSSGFLTRFVTTYSYTINVSSPLGDCT